MDEMIFKIRGTVEVHVRNVKTGETYIIPENSNAISTRSKLILSRMLGSNNKLVSSQTWPGSAGLYPKDSVTLTDGFSFGDSTNGKHFLGITGMVFGNGGHLMYNTTNPAGNPIPRVPTLSSYTAASPIGTMVDTRVASNFAMDTTKPAMPWNGTSFGYQNQANNPTPNPSSYVRVENGIVPWQGTSGSENEDNDVGVSEPNSTLYSETYRLPLDEADGVKYLAYNKVQFKCTVPADCELNQNRLFGFARQARNLITEIGLISGDNLTVQSPDFSTTSTDSASITSVVDNGSGSARFMTASTGSLAINEVVEIRGTGIYDGFYTVTAISANTYFEVAEPYTASATGTWYYVEATAVGETNNRGAQLWTGATPPNDPSIDEPGDVNFATNGWVGSEKPKDFNSRAEGRTQYLTSAGDATNYSPSTGGNTWNLFSRRLFGALTKTSDFEFVFLWTITF